MDINALLMDTKDNIVVCVKDVALGSKVIYSQNGQLCTLSAKDNIPACHKVAIKPIEKGADVLKYGERIGRSTCAIEVGQLVDHNNIYSVPRDYESELIEETDEDVPQFVPTKNGVKFWGYRRAEGRPGIRNHVLFCRVARAAAKPPVLSQAKCVALSTSFSTQDARTWQPIQPCLRKFSPDLPAIRMSMVSSLSVLAARQSDTKSCAKRSVP